MKCERLEDALAAEDVAAAKERARKLDADRERSMQAVKAAARSIPVASPPVVIPVVPFVRERDYSCLSTVTLSLNSSNYSGLVDIELRSGSRPGSRLVDRTGVYSSGIVKITNVCPGSYFFAFATPDSSTVSTTRYFTVESDLQGYSNPEITVTYSRNLGLEGQRVGHSARSAL